MPGKPHTVSDVMTRTVAAIGRDAPFKDVVTLMEEWRVSALPVLEGEGRVIGVVSEADLLPKEEFRGSDPDRFTQRQRLDDLAKAGAVTAGELMSTPAVTVHPSATLGQAARILARHRVKRLPVVDSDGLLQGVVSRSDLLKVFLCGDEELAEEVRHEVVDRLFPLSADHIQVEVAEGVVTLTGWVADNGLAAVAERLARAVEGVVDVHCCLVPASARSDSR
ncbi:CBS domain-containing protein [Streptomyces sp. NPDC001714]|uniref:CBS domain-containing protein n=1 Tax=Streptomyces sp. NPDC001714 TaxID=3364603 RepID=UPI0036A73229